MSIIRQRMIGLIFLFYSLSVIADDNFKLSLPVSCEINQDCWIVNYVDVEPLPNNAKDFQCGPRSYDGHKGTDITIRDWQEMVRGINVLAAADGKVLRVRDGVEDKQLSREQLNKIKKDNKACGNGVFVDHGNGWETIYCHLKKGSIIVEPNQNVKAGQKLAQLGHSGFVEFPHLHIGVMKNKTMLDPFTGLSNQLGCNETKRSLWQDNNLQTYNPVSIYANGFSDSVPKFKDIKQDASSPHGLGTDIPALIFWVSIFGVQKDDLINMQIFDTEGKLLVERKIVQHKTRARQFLYIGKKNQNESLLNGEYKGKIILKRKLSNGGILEETMQQKVILH